MSALKVCEEPVFSVASVVGAVATMAPTAGVNAIVVEADFVKSAREIAVRVTSGGCGRLAGAVYVMGMPGLLKNEDSLPQERPPQSGPVSLQMTPRLPSLLDTLAVTDIFCATAVEDALGVIVTESADDVTMTMASADFVLSATEVGVTMIVDGGRAEGAVYVIGMPEAPE